MKANRYLYAPSWHRVALSLLVFSYACALTVLADVVQMENGDRYVGEVLSMDKHALVLKSDVLGNLRLAREKVASVAFGANAAPALAHHGTNQVLHAPVQIGTNASFDLSPLVRQLGASSNLLHQVQSQFLSTAGPAANDKFNELVGGLMSGKITVNDIRAQASSAANQLRAARRELGEDAGFAIDGYLAILDHFLKETAADAAPAPASPPKTSKPAPLEDE